MSNCCGSIQISRGGSGGLTDAELETRLGEANAPSATELGYVKGLTSAAQTQLNTNNTLATSGSDPGHSHTNASLSDTGPSAIFDLKGGVNSPFIRYGTSMSNLLLRSEEFDNAAWAKSAGTITCTATNAVCPNGLSNADTLTGTASGDNVIQIVTNSGTGSYTFSVWLWVPTTPVDVTISLYDNTGTPVTNSLLCSLTTTPTRFSITTVDFPGASSKYCKILVDAQVINCWGGQLNAGATATPYCQTGTAAATSVSGRFQISAPSPDLSAGSGATWSFYRVLASSGFWITSTAQMGGLTTARAAGTAYSLTNTSALLNFGTTDPTINLPVAFVYYELSGFVRLDYTTATFSAPRTVTLKIRKTNGTAADLISIQCLTEIITTGTKTMIIATLPKVDYYADGTNTIELWGDVSVVPEAGTLDAVDAQINARIIK